MEVIAITKPNEAMEVEVFKCTKTKKEMKLGGGIKALTVHISNVEKDGIVTFFKGNGVASSNDVLVPVDQDGTYVIQLDTSKVAVNGKTVSFKSTTNCVISAFYPL